MLLPVLIFSELPGQNTPFFIFRSARDYIDRKPITEDQFVEYLLKNSTVVSFKSQRERRFKHNLYLMVVVPVAARLAFVTLNLFLEVHF